MEDIKEENKSELEEEIVEDVNTDGKGKIYFPKTGIIIISSILVLMIICVVVILCNGGPVK